MNNSLSLSAKHDVALTEKAETMTVKEVAEAVGVSYDTINNAVKRCFPEIVKNGVTTRLNEAHVAVIVKELKNNNAVTDRLTFEVSSKVKNTTTRAEIIANYKAATQAIIDLLEAEKAEMRQRAEIAEGTLNRISDGKGCYSMNQTAKALKLPYGNIKLYERLRKEGILNADNSPRQDQINAGHFKVVAKFINDTVGSKPVTLTTGKGLVYLAKKFNTTIDETIQADAE